MLWRVIIPLFPIFFSHCFTYSFSVVLFTLYFCNFSFLYTRKFEKKCENNTRNSWISFTQIHLLFISNHSFSLSLPPPSISLSLFLSLSCMFACMCICTFFWNIWKLFGDYTFNKTRIFYYMTTTLFSNPQSIFMFHQLSVVYFIAICFPRQVQDLIWVQTLHLVALCF